jgi:hypothetical protein
MKFMKSIKRILLITVLSTATLTMSYGQAALIVLILGDKVATENFHLSMDGAFNLASLPGLEKGKIFLGANFGLGTHIKLSDKLYLKPEFKPLSQKGFAKVNALVGLPEGIEPVRTDIRLNYIEIPVLLQYNITKRLYISSGPQISFLTSGKQLSEATINGKDVTLRLDTKSLFNNIDFSVPVELGYSLTLSRKKTTTTLDINAFVRYCYGFTEVINDATLGSAHNSTIQLGISLPFIKSPEELATAKK